MKIQEQNILWRWYCRLYKKEKWTEAGVSIETPHPGNLCCFFWKAMMGLLISVLVDTPLWLLGPIWAGVIVGVYFLASNFGDSGFIVGMSALLAGLLVLFACAIMLRSACGIGDWVEKLDRKSWTYFILKVIGTIVLSSLVIALLGMIVSMAFCFGGRPTSDHFLTAVWNGVKMFVIWLLLPFCGLFILLLIGQLLWDPIASIRGVQMTASFLKAKKRKICPLVEPPDSWDGDK